MKKFLCLIKIYFLFYSDFGFIIAVGHGNNNNDVFSKMKKPKTNAIYFWVGGCGCGLRIICPLWLTTICWTWPPAPVTCRIWPERTGVPPWVMMICRPPPCSCWPPAAEATTICCLMFCAPCGLPTTIWPPGVRATPPGCSASLGWPCMTPPGRCNAREIKRFFIHFCTFKNKYFWFQNNSFCLYYYLPILCWPGGSCCGLKTAVCPPAPVGEAFTIGRVIVLMERFIAYDAACTTPPKSKDI